MEDELVGYFTSPNEVHQCGYRFRRVIISVEIDEQNLNKKFY